MNITTIIELENREVEELVGAKFMFVQEQIHENIVHTCVESFIDEQTHELVEIDDAIEKLFGYLKENNVISADIEDFSYELPSCEKVKKANSDMEDVPQKVVISYEAKK